MSTLIAIGRFAQITRLTHKALRVYDEMGLLPPAVVDRNSGYRYYSHGQVIVAARIRLLRSLDVPLEDIRRLLQDPRPGALRAVIEQQKTRLEERIAACTTALITLDRLADSDQLPYEVRVKQICAQPILFIRAAFRIADMDAAMPPAMDELRAHLARHDLAPAGPEFCAYPYPESSADEFVADACIPVASPVAGEGRIQTSEIAPGCVAYALHVGPYAELPLTLQAVVAWIHGHGHDITGSLRETYLTGPGPGQHPANYVTEVAWPIR